MYWTSVSPAGQWDNPASQRNGDEDMHESDWRDWVRQYLRGLEVQIVAVRGLEARVDTLERKQPEHEVRLRVGRPWETEGISRSAWLPRRKSVGSS
jgi:hypothetical protein